MKALSICRIPLTLMPFLCLVAFASAKTVHVNRNASGANNGSSWTDAYTTLQAAMAASVSGDQVWIAAGTYRPNDHDPANLSRLLKQETRTNHRSHPHACESGLFLAKTHAFAKLAEHVVAGHADSLIEFRLAA